MSATAATRYRIFVFNWNTESISLGETLDPEQAQEHRAGTLSPWRYPAEIPDFHSRLLEMIQHANPDLVVIGFQEDRHPGSYFHSHLLPETMPTIGYHLVKRTKLMGIGVTSIKGLSRGDLFRRGIRVSIYAKAELVPLIEREERHLRAAISNDGQSEHLCSSMLIRGKGATVSYVMLPGVGPLAFICCHLPFHAESLITERHHQNRMLRQNEIAYGNTCFNDIINHLVILNPHVPPAHVIFFGDFNYRVSIIDRRAPEIARDLLGPDSAAVRKIMYEQYDELKEQMRRKNIYEFAEGISNRGPEFLPTCKMTQGRYELLLNHARLDAGTPPPQIIWKMGKHAQRVPSWCDRILYATFGEHPETISCVLYDRFDYGTVMSKSDHAAVVAILELHRN